MPKITLNATHWRTKRDNEDELIIQFKIPATDAQQALTIPNNKNLIMTIEEGYATK
jgi:hypothetical protein